MGIHEGNAAVHPPTARPLSAIETGQQARVCEVLAAEETLARRLIEIGFVRGAIVEVVATMWPGDDPLAIRVGGATFALRRREAEQVLVEGVRRS